ncbi:MAG: leucyl aminopeptidase family protein [Deltaproteobacteria bacterium]|jgi:leucyl aminopeptidase
MPKLIPVERLADALASADYDALVVVAPAPETGAPEVDRVLAAAAAADAQLAGGVTLLVDDAMPKSRLVFSGTGPVTRDYDDVRAFGDAAKKGVQRARDAGAQAPLLFVTGVPKAPGFERTLDVALLEAAGGLWEPLEAREALGSLETEPVSKIGFVAPSDGARTAALVTALEAGRRAARDVTGTEPERMTPTRAVEYAMDLFRGTKVKASQVAERDKLQAGYPLLDAVARASYPVERHRPRVLRLEYTGEGEVTRSYFFAGKGVVYDTGGADIKAGGHMAGMSRDKGGAGAVVGLFVAASKLLPKGVKLVAEIGFVRNSVGADAFVSDEIITSHAGVRVRIGNTDAEGRLVLADLLSHLREEALTAKAPALFSVATLTGHAGRAVGPYSIAVENGPARHDGIAQSLSSAGDTWADPFEITRSRREDFAFIRPRSRADDVLSCNNAASSVTARGHQFPMAFLAIASGLDKHGRDGHPPLAYAHLDIGGSGVEGGDWQHGRPTAAPVVALTAALGLMGV